ncbi:MULTISPECIES: hypothetical protein [unclassified Mycobacterium]|uniref:hypothetical protein n=1 Tax=unclassified Mycobacterium TaxID=2642494 RepID=UPI0007FDCAE5|nr:MULTISPECIES: hypothetical protein [unclassified Mycobacterium]OBG65101.1 hypothetical protein A5704_12815 [Mycobacterium sp. E735]OBG76310.1 hypothetical protein A9X05_02750 [Mycobacterium sp. E3298]OBG81701.1 hypothetical protein A5701_10145 [Mycobacterium sp. E3305]OBH23252.1 hypothetical protein A9X03_14685 [Mycobacterium sp. E1715]
MIEPLVVEPSRLENAGNTLQQLPFPTPPAPIVAPGTDAVSAAINATLPIIESPVTDGLPAVKAALTKTGSSIAAAAAMYADTDERLGDHLTQVQFLSSAKEPASGSPGVKPEADKPNDGDEPSPAKPSPQPGSPVPQPGELAGATGPLGSVMQGMQGAMGSLQGMQGAGSAPAQLADSNKKDQAPTDEDRRADEEDGRPDAQSDGAAPGAETAEKVPAEPISPAGPQAAPSGVTL